MIFARNALLDRIFSRKKQIHGGSGQRGPDAVSLAVSERLYGPEHVHQKILAKDQIKNWRCAFKKIVTQHVRLSDANPSCIYATLLYRMSRVSSVRNSVN